MKNYFHNTVFKLLLYIYIYNNKMSAVANNLSYADRNIDYQWDKYFNSKNGDNDVNDL
jgi:hypothetical protein